MKRDIWCPTSPGSPLLISIEYKFKISTGENRPMTILYEGRVYEPARWGATPGKGRRYQQG